MDLMNILTNFGFPVFCVICCFWYINKNGAETRSDFNSLHEIHAEEVKSLNSALIANTEVLRDLKETIDDIKTERRN